MEIYQYDTNIIKQTNEQTNDLLIFGAIKIIMKNWKETATNIDVWSDLTESPPTYTTDL